MKISRNVVQLPNTFFGKLLQNSFAIHQDSQRLAHKGFRIGIAAGRLQHRRIDKADPALGAVYGARNGQGRHNAAREGKLTLELVHHDIEGAAQIADFILRRIRNAAAFPLIHHAHGKSGRLLKGSAYAAARKDKGKHHANQQRAQHAQRQIQSKQDVLTAFPGLAGRALLNTLVQFLQRSHNPGDLALIIRAENQRTSPLHVRRHAVVALYCPHGLLFQLYQRIGELNRLTQQGLLLGCGSLFLEQICQRNLATGGNLLVLGTRNLSCPFVHNGMILPFVFRITCYGKRTNLLRQHTR